MRQKFANFYAEYGKVGIATYFTISTSIFVTLYAALKAGVDVRSVAQFVGIDAARFETGGVFLLAAALSKMLLPVKISLAVYLTPKVKRLLSKSP